jgi:lipoprotein signal peptidase
MWLELLYFWRPWLPCVGCDQVTKSAARRHLERGTTVSFFHDCVRLHYVENPGAFLSMGDSRSAALSWLEAHFYGRRVVDDWALFKPSVPPASAEAVWGT